MPAGGRWNRGTRTKDFQRAARGAARHGLCAMFLIAAILPRYHLRGVFDDL
jgi:hypothetical protein